MTWSSSLGPRLSWYSESWAIRRSDRKLVSSVGESLLLAKHSDAFAVLEHLLIANQFNQKLSLLDSKRSKKLLWSEFIIQKCKFRSRDGASK